MSGEEPSSISFLQEPDIAIEMQMPDESLRTFLFDPKYKLDSDDAGGGEPADGKPKKVDIDKMHAYRDSIRRSDGSCAVEYAAILYPSTTISYSPGLEALEAYPGRARMLRQWWSKDLVCRASIHPCECHDPCASLCVR